MHLIPMVPIPLIARGAVVYGIRKNMNSKFGDYTANDLYNTYSSPGASNAVGTVKLQ